jgi:cytochrome P450
MFIPPYPKPHKSKASLLVSFFRGWSSWLNQLSEKSYSMKIGQVKKPGKDAFIINDTDLVRKILVDEVKQYPKHGFMYKMLEPLVGSSIFTTNGEVWERQRRLVDAGFSQTRLRLAFPLMTAAVNAMLDRMRPQATGVAFEIDAEMTHVTADIIFRSILSEVLTEEEAQSIFKAFNDYQVHATRAVLLNTYHLPSYFSYRASKKAANKIRPVIAAVICRRYAEQQQDNLPQYNDILAGMMAAEDPITHDKLSYEEMVDQVCTLFLAGHETTASSLTWGMYLLSNCPHLQQQMLVELDAVAPNRPLEFEDIKKLNVTTNVFKETLRLYPPIGSYPREATSDHCLRGKNITLGSYVIIAPWLIHRHGEYWDNPHAFQPERFETEAGKASAKCAYLPFSKGARVCTGQSFAMQEAILILANLVRAFEMVKVDGHIPKPAGRMTIRPDNGVKIILKTRTPVSSLA